MARQTTIALVGNPNSGKTTLFNALTGQRQHVGNYPGVTVQVKEGFADHKGAAVRIVDLPGTYSLTPYSGEEILTRDFIIEHRPDVVIDIVDASNLERNLYLATQLLELGVPLVLALNMWDVAQQRGTKIDCNRLSTLLGVPVVATVASSSQGLSELLDAAMDVAARPLEAVAAQKMPDYGREIEPHVQQMMRQVADAGIDEHCRWLALKLLEGDVQTQRRLGRLCPQSAESLKTQAAALKRHIESVCGDSCQMLLPDRRYGFISGACAEAVAQTARHRREVSDSLDLLLTHRLLGLPIFALLMYLTFQMTFWLGNPIVEVLDGWREQLAAAVRATGDGTLQSLLADGVIEGVGAVLVFVPLIFLLYVAIAILEDSGYMARAAFLLDGLMHRIGLHGKSFVPMLIGFGCTVPAMLATRILETRRDRLTTLMVLPLMSCGARLPVYVLIIGALFPPRTLLHVGGVTLTNQGMLLFGIYVIGIVLAVALTRIFRWTILRGPAEPFVMELPPYRMPTLKGLLLHVADHTWLYARKAGTIILAISLVLWAMKTYPKPSGEQYRQTTARAAVLAATAEQGDAAGEELAELQGHMQQIQLEQSAIGRIGKAISPALTPCGFDWKISTALLGAFAAKEVFVSQMGIIHAVDGQSDRGAESLRQKLAAQYTPLQGFCIMLFILVASPCMATVAAAVREARWKWAVFQWSYLTVLAWLLTTGVYQLGRLL